MSTTPELLYFDIRGRAEPIRLLLEDIGIQYTNKQVNLKDWAAIRSTTPFHRMPVYTDGDIEIPESFAIMNYLGRKYDLLGKGMKSQVRCDVAVEAWRDYGNRVASVFGALSTSEAARKTFIDTEQLSLLSDIETFYLNKASAALYWVGNAPTVVDYFAFHLIDGIASQFPRLLSQLGALKEFHEYFSERTNIKIYLASNRRPEALFYGPNGKVFPR